MNKELFVGFFALYLSLFNTFQANFSHTNNHLPIYKVSYTSEEKRAISLHEKFAKSTVKVYTFDKKGNLHATGSGLLISNDGKILTCRHVLEGAASWKVSFGDSQTLLDVKVLKTSKKESADLAVIQVIPSSQASELLQIEPFKFENPKNVKPGMNAYILGSPYGIPDTFTQGHVSKLPSEDTENWLQIDGFVNPGNSGGPIIDSEGNVIGVVVATLAPKGKGQVGIGYAVSLADILEFLGQ